MFGAFFAKPIIKYGLSILGGIAIILVPYCYGKKVAKQQMYQDGLEDLVVRERDFHEIREKRTNEYNKIENKLDSGDTNDQYKSDLLSNRPYSS